MKKMRSWIHGLRGKLLMSAVFPVIGFVAISVLNINGLSKMGTMLDGAYNDVIPSLDDLGHMESSRQAMSNNFWGFLANESDKNLRQEFLNRLKSSFADFKKYQDAYERTPSSEEETKNYEIVKQNKEVFHKASQDIIHFLEIGTPESDQQARQVYFSVWREAAHTISAMTSKNILIYQTLAKEMNQQQEALYRQNFNITIFASLCAIFALIGILMWMAQRISRSVEKIASSLTESGGVVTDSIQQLTDSGQTLSQSSISAAASLEETVAALEQMSSMVNMNTDNAKQASALSQAARNSAEQGEKEMQSLILSMNEISQSSKKIEDIINVIDDIAFQTNLLALNAAVEAARAGEQGKGFAVVADAVRSLAQKSALAAKDITHLIKDSVMKIEKGTQSADRSGASLNTIVSSVKKVADLNQEISTASNEQSIGIGQVGKAMNQLDQSSQNNAASAEEIAATAEDLLQQSKTMQERVSELNYVILGFRDLGETKRPKKAVESEAAKKEKAKVVSIEIKKAASKMSKVGTTDGF